MVKHNADSSIERFKARIIAKDYSQCPGLDYNESFAPTFRPATLCIIMAMSAVEDLELRSVDITAAFINGDLEEEIYMNQPEGFHIGSPSKVCHLRKSLYGLKQSARQWNKKLHSVLTELGFKQIQSNPITPCISTLMERFVSLFPFTLMILLLPPNLLPQLISTFNFSLNTSIWDPLISYNYVIVP
jgi:hypothetical protein